MGQYSRRQFIKIGASGAGVAALGSGLVSNWWGLDGPILQSPATDGDRIIPTFCEMCFWKCGVLAHVKDGRVTKIVGNPAHPLSKGRLCPRGVGATGLLYDPDRLKKPLLRVNKRGEEIFQEVSWETALDRVSEGMSRIRDRHGPEALALFAHGFGGSWFRQLMSAFGSANIAGPSYAQCRGPREAAFGITFGQSLGSPENIDIENTRCLTLLGSHLGENIHNTQVQELAAAIGRGAELVVVDPRFSIAAGKARYWLPIKPGTDLALLLAWIHVVVKEKRYDSEYIAKYAEGFDELARHVEDKTPEWAYPLTGIKPDLIRDSARFLASFRPASLIHPGRHTTWYGDDTQRLRAVAILAALLGNWGRRGGYIRFQSMELPPYPIPKPENKPPEPADRPQKGMYPFADELLTTGICDAAFPGKAPYQIKGWLVYGTNLMQSLPDPRQVRKAIQGLDLVVSIDVLPAEICGWSDVVLPEATYLERYDDLYNASYKQPFIALRQPVVDPMYESKPGWWIARELALRLKLEKYFPWEDAAQLLKHRLRAGGYDWEELRRTGVIVGKTIPVCEEDGLPPSFTTDRGKIVLHSKELQAMGFDPLPAFSQPEEPPPGMFRLLTGRAAVHTFGRTANNRFLAQCYSENEVWINSDAAASIPGFEDRPLQSGDRVVLENQDGVRSYAVKAHITQRIRGDCVFVVHGFGHSARGLSWACGKGASDSELTTRYKTDPMSGATGMNVNFVRVLKAEAEA